MSLLRRVDIEKICMVIEALRYKDISRMVGHDDDAVYDLGRVLDNKILQRRAVEIMELVDTMPYESLHSRRLWDNKEFLQIVQDLMHRIDLEISKIDNIENKPCKVDVSEPIHIAQTIPEVEENTLENFKVDGRWKESTIVSKAREYVDGLDDWTDEDILLELGIVEEPHYEDNGLSNDEYTNMMKERRNK